MINKFIVFMIILMCGTTIKENIEKTYPEVYNNYLKERATWKWYKRMWYLK